MAKKQHNEIDWTDEEEEIIWVSKSEIKRDAEDLKKLGTQLVELSNAKLDTVPLNENLKEAITLAQRLKMEARRRQIQYIGKLLRQCDVEPIQEALDKLNNTHKQQQAMLHKIEVIREQLIEQGDAAINNLMTDYPTLDRQKLRSLVRGVLKERENNKPPKNFREIYQYLKSIMLN
ncbi:ribosome biogenesis factor YjgA [Phocoenobacter skyensis]|uniref:Dual-action ribosomal maturation protein DarP n=1 Tax=Phocoenobacter skyensis TaxID=97481 RepID=A0A1H7VTZ1_9PAST|nr:ribosome biogenesis factor YjgA [Pasteurella skyensis]MDP8078917.1 ribosome biogenesis factor YjgA [Pasteurella skyensis]MDP8084770.1 ribosome biogenesis factor YjgA [Pasteurella skyensis]MDP8162384.1 ribosome biogenesis factor YjgA [Pasteurella skyensis]MDP8169738.1 ribosome biogenesis factor YjgA [Pasteurella skyensis]MDP8172282.1 ribosome biogenesis factor YjgA [Pasteurella skyensis]